jgi:hypothetical protein
MAFSWWSELKASSLISLGLRLLRAEERIYPHLHCPDSLVNYKY